MPLNTQAVQQCLKSFNFKTLFREHLGWDNPGSDLTIKINDTPITLTAIAHKRGFAVYAYPSIPDKQTCMKIDRQVTKSAHEHFIIYADEAAGKQMWQWVRRETGKPITSREQRFDITQSGTPLIQRLEQISISVEEEEKGDLTLSDVVGRVRSTLDVDKITKKFYDEFKGEHTAFMKRITGIKHEPDLQWYTSLMLNRIMFVYFIQKKGFLDSDPNYLRNRLGMVQAAYGKNKFQKFYRYFLLNLFHEGLGQPEDERKPEMKELLGKVPYLNGGFFEVHQLEEVNPKIHIPDDAFEQIFNFFDRYQWHLDERPLRNDNEINPDVVGYIFEKYINQKQMGAYYTKEDITEYISKNTILPYLFDSAHKKCAVAFKPDSAMWQLLRDTPDRYIYPAMRQGVIDENGKIIKLPKDIEAGIKDVSKRGGWNKPADKDYALPTETWREHVARRQRCLEVRKKLSRGEVHEINDLITLNLDIWQFASDAIVEAEGPELLRAFWHTLAGKPKMKSNQDMEPGITILDPTCGSGAFLFAALRILETLYGDCLERMRRFIEEDDARLQGETGKQSKKKYEDFRQITEQIGEHPSERYFTLKSIIINNLFGVDIMDEAVEICKLRLFLTLAAQVETFEQIEPLPDIDFNVRAGNALVGYASADEVRKAFEEDRVGESTQVKLMSATDSENYKHFEEKLKDLDSAFKQFRAQQTIHGGLVTAEDKQNLRDKSLDLRSELDTYLAGEYGKSVDKPGEFVKWQASHTPFHWFVEFYGIIHNGGFDIIIGNPPYVSYTKIKKTYQVIESDFATIDCGNLYACVVERVFQINKGRYGFILPLSSTNANGNVSFQNTVRKTSCLHISHYAVRPSKLFNGVDMNLSIILGGLNGAIKHNTTTFRRWPTSFRDSLFETLHYVTHNISVKQSAFPKFGNKQEINIWSKLKNSPDRLKRYSDNTSSVLLSFHAFGRYWRKCITEKLSDNYQEISINEDIFPFSICALNSQLIYWYWIIGSDCYRFTKTDVFNFPIPDKVTDSQFADLSTLLLESYEANSKVIKKLLAIIKSRLRSNFFQSIQNPS